jgi:hypothetical protein
VAISTPKAAATPLPGGQGEITFIFPDTEYHNPESPLLSGVAPRWARASGHRGDGVSSHGTAAQDKGVTHPVPPGCAVRATPLGEGTFAEATPLPGTKGKITPCAPSQPQPLHPPRAGNALPNVSLRGAQRRGNLNAESCCNAPARWQGRDHDPSFLGAGSGRSIS